MRRCMMIAASVAVVGVLSAPAGASVRGDVRHSAKVVYAHAARRLGARALGRDIARDGVATRHGSRRATTAELRRWRAALLTLLHPRRRMAVYAHARAAVVPYGSTGTASGLPACADESHGDYSTGPANTNASGATGRWQEMPMHRQPGGICYGLDLSPAGQDACAVRIYRTQGAGAWTACG